MSENMSGDIFLPITHSSPRERPIGIYAVQ